MIANATEIMALALERIDALMDAEPDTPEAKELAALAAAVQTYEEETAHD